MASLSALHLPMSPSRSADGLWSAAGRGNRRVGGGDRAG